MPLGDGKGVAGMQFGSPSSVLVGTSSTVVLTAGQTEQCEYISIVNDSDTTIYIGIGAAAELNKGTRLNANGGACVFEMPVIPKGVAINAICASSNKNLVIQVGS